MVAERAADLIRGRTALKQVAEVWEAPEWQTRQRVGAPQRPLAPGPALQA